MSIPIVADNPASPVCPDCRRRLIVADSWDLCVVRDGVDDGLIGVIGRLCRLCRVLFVDPDTAALMSSHGIVCRGIIANDAGLAARLMMWRPDRP